MSVIGDASARPQGVHGGAPSWSLAWPRMAEAAQRRPVALKKGKKKQRETPSHKMRNFGLTKCGKISVHLAREHADRIKQQCTPLSFAACCTPVAAAYTRTAAACTGIILFVYSMHRWNQFMLNLSWYWTRGSSQVSRKQDKHKGRTDSVTHAVTRHTRAKRMLRKLAENWIERHSVAQRDGHMPMYHCTRASKLTVIRSYNPHIFRAETALRTRLVARSPKLRETQAHIHPSLRLSPPRLSPPRS